MSNHQRPVADVLRDSRESFRQLEKAVAALSEADLLEPQRFPWMAGTSLAEMIIGNSCEHFYSDHEPSLQAWLRSLPV